MKPLFLLFKSMGKSLICMSCSSENTSTRLKILCFIFCRLQSQEKLGIKTAFLRTTEKKQTKCFIVWSKHQRNTLSVKGSNLLHLKYYSESTSMPYNAEISL